MTKLINAQYQGYLQTPNLWLGNAVYNLQQLELLNNIQSLAFHETLPKNIRLGKRVEQFVFHELKQFPEITIISENLQVQQEKHTIGEIDALLLINDKPVHLEIIYKFYVYDESITHFDGDQELAHWIGPNRKDSLLQKLDKLKDKQLPLLYHPDALKYLEKYTLDPKKIEQKVLFKAQLFVPFNKTIPACKLINPACIAGFSLKKEDLPQFKTSKFYIPTKADWLLEAYTEVTWLTYSSFMDTVTLILQGQTAPLVWIKRTNGEIYKSFIIWW